LSPESQAEIRRVCAFVEEALGELRGLAGKTLRSEERQSIEYTLDQVEGYLSELKMRVVDVQGGP